MTTERLFTRAARGCGRAEAEAVGGENAGARAEAGGGILLRRVTGGSPFDYAVANYITEVTA